ncbi:MAG: ABC transporter substrate-binding protein [Cyanobacteria bacterium P01_D01_bin.6]
MNNSSSPNKNISVILSFSQGTTESGFLIAARLLKSGMQVDQGDNLRIPAVPELNSRYQDWRKYYIDQGRSVSRSGRAMDLPPATIAYSSVSECREAAKSLALYLDQRWFERAEFQAIKEWIRGRILVHTDQSVPVFFEFNTGSREQDILLRRLPWSRWNLFKELPNTEPALGIAFGQPVSPTLKNIRVLIVLGTDEGGLDLEADNQFVSELEKIGAQVKPLFCPTPRELHVELMKSSYDVLFFAGHSLSEEDQRDGSILLKPKTFVSIEALSPSLQSAVRKGLRLAIFNSCDGLGLADPLIRREKIPSVVVFREPVPDEVARTFLKYFLEEFSAGKPLFLSIREARNQLRFLEDRPEDPLPSASWLPVVCQNPSQPEIVLEPVEQLEPEPESILSLKREVLDRDTGPTLKNWGLKLGIAAALILALLGLIALWRSTEKQASGDFRSTSSSDLPDSPELSKNLISDGDKLILTSETNNLKEKGIGAYADGEWDAAIAAFRESLNEELNSNSRGSLDPETLIYLNNAIAEKNVEQGTGQLIKLGIAIPGEADVDPSKEILRGGVLRQTEFNCTVDKISNAIKSVDAELDCQGDQGRFIHFTIADDQDNADTAASVAAALSQESIVGVVGHYSSSSCKEAVKVYEKNNIVIISPTCTSTSLTGISDYFFRTVPNDEIAAESLLAAVGASTKRVAVAYVQDEDATYSRSFKESFESGLMNQSYVYICDSISGSFSASQCSREVEQQDSDFLLLVPHDEETTNKVLPILWNLGEGITPLGSDSVYGPKVIQEYGPEAAEKGLLIYVSWHPNQDNRVPFEDSAYQLFNVYGGWNWRTQSSFDAASALAQAALNSTVNTGEDLKNVLRTESFVADGVAGEDSVKFDSDGNRDLKGFEDEIGVIVSVEGYQDVEGETKYTFKRVDD